MATTKVILVGGFLGAGKTTLLARAAERLASQGKRVGLVANDQAADLVDTELLKETGSQVEEVAGGCFCCRFPDMIAAMQRLAGQGNADVLIGEPVGSCTDLSATVMQPLKKLHGHEFDVAPFSVLVDGNQVRVLDRLRRTFAQNASARFPDDVLYIYEKQLEEADLIVLNKADLLSAAELADLRSSLAGRFPDTPLLSMSAAGGEGVDAWLDYVGGSRPAGGKIAEVDYDTYAAGEAALGWLNASARLQTRVEIDWQALAGKLLEAIRDELRRQSAEIAHLKLYLTAAAGRLVGNVTGNDAPLSLRGEIDGGQTEAVLLINARVHVRPDVLREIVERALEATTRDRMTATITAMHSFFPGRPQPTYRYGAVVLS
jgi:Ni2+-binding GTPase involved in maturation of urease and hydrogenase